MIEHRANWKQELGEQARSRAEQRQSLLVQLDVTRKDIQSTGTNFEKYDSLKQQQREIVARLAVL